MTTGSLAYIYQRTATKADQPNDPKVEFALDISSEGRFTLRYSDKDQPEKCFDLTQVPGQPISLSLPRADKPRVLRAPSIWHLLIIDDEDCGKQFLPMLESIRARLARGPHSTARRRRIGENGRPCRKSRTASNGRPGSINWAIRSLHQADRADHNLRDVGPAVLGYLNRLNMSQLDAEQKSRTPPHHPRPVHADRRRYARSTSLPC